MARLEATHLGAVDIPMNLIGAVAIPEMCLDTSTLSPTDSVDSAIGDSPRPAGNSGKYLSYGGPGFSVASFDGMTGSVERIPVPLPLSCAEIAEFVAFPQSPVMCMSIVGETQVWVGSEAGSLHVFELGKNLRFTSHSITMLDSSILCIASLCIASQHSINTTSDTGTTLQSAVRSLRIDILLGSSNGAVTIISGGASPNGGLSNPSIVLRKPRKVLDLTKHEETEEGEMGREKKVNCIAAVHMTDERGGQTFWCSYGRTIVIFHKDGWEEIGRLDSSLGHPEFQHTVPKDSEIVLLVNSEHGVWSALSNSPTVSLWDSNTMAPKINISCCTLCDTCPTISSEVLQITALHFSYPYLFVGTSMGDLVVFRIFRKNSVGHRKQPSLEYKVLTAEHCGPIPILDIFASQLRTSENSMECQSPSRSIATPTSLQVLVVCGPKLTTTPPVGSSSDISSSKILFYDLLTSPSPSPLASSPLHIITPRPSSSTYDRRCSRPSSSYDRRCSSVVSNSSITSSSLSSTQRRRSMLSLYDGTLPKLSFYSASPSAHSLLPLRTS